MDNSPDIKDFTDQEVMTLFAAIQEKDWNFVEAELISYDQINNIVTDILFNNGSIAESAPLSFLKKAFKHGYKPGKLAAENLVNMASFNGDADKFKFLVGEAKLTIPNIAIINAPTSGSLELVKYLISLGYTPEEDVFHPLSLCLEHADENPEYVKIINYIIENFDIDFVNQPKILGCYIENAKTLERFIKEKDFNIHSLYLYIDRVDEAWPILMFQIHHNHTDAVCFLLDQGASPMHKILAKNKDAIKKYANEDIKKLLRQSIREHQASSRTNTHMLDNMGHKHAVAEAMANGYFPYALDRIKKEKRSFTLSDFKLRHVDGETSNVGTILALRGDLNKVFTTEAWSHVPKDTAYENIKEIFTSLPTFARRKVRNDVKLLLENLNILNTQPTKKPPRLHRRKRPSP